MRPTRRGFVNPVDLDKVQFSTIQNLACDCGFKPTDKDAVFGMEEGVVFFDCPMCGQRWEMVRKEKLQ
jgi:hypothetical protein